jgi:hypothetical protein
MKKILSYTALFVFTALALSSCKKDEETEEMITPLPGVIIPTSTIQVNPIHLWEDTPFEMGTTYSINGVDVQFDEVRFYLSKFMMTDMMDITEPGETAILVSAASASPMSIGGTSLNHVHSLGFLFGLDSITNHQDPTLALAPLNDPLMMDLAEGMNELQLNIDYAQMFEGVDFANLSGTHGASDLTNGIADNIQNDVLSFE